MICYCEECGRPLDRTLATRVGAYRRRLRRAILLFAFTSAASGAALASLAWVAAARWVR